MNASPRAEAPTEDGGRLLQASNAWRVTALLAAANLLNYYDRAIPAIVIEPIKEEFGLSDAAIGVLGGAFTVVYALAGIALGRLADRASRRTVIGIGLIVWSVFTALSGLAWGFATLLLFRLGVGVGEASYAPAANSLLADLFPAHKRSRATAVFQLGLPLGLILAFFTTGAIVDAFGSFRAPFFVAAVPGLILAFFMLRLKEPARGASEEQGSPSAAVSARPIRSILSIPTMRWLVLSGIGLQVAAQALGTFLVPLNQRYFDQSLTVAAINAGVVQGLAGLIGLLLAGIAADRAFRVSRRRRVHVGAMALTLAAPLSAAALWLGPGQAGLFVALLSTAWLLQFAFHTTAYPVVADVVEPRLRATAIAVFFAAFYLLGGAFGPLLAGVLSDAFANSVTPPGDVSDSANGLRLALLCTIPSGLALAAIGMWGASRTVQADHARAAGGGHALRYAS